MVGLLAVSRRLTIHSNAKPRLLAATPPIDAASLPLQGRNARRQLVAPRLQSGNLRSRRQCPARDCQWNAGTENRNHNAPEAGAQGGAPPDPLQGLGGPLALRPQHLQLLDQRPPYFVAHPCVEIPGVCTHLFQVTLCQLLMRLHTFHEQADVHGRVIDGMNAVSHTSGTRSAGYHEIPPPRLRARGAAATPAWRRGAPVATLDPTRTSDIRRGRAVVRFAKAAPPVPR